MSSWMARRRAARRAARFGGMHPALRELLGANEEPSRETACVALVGWMVPMAHTVRGEGHVCIICRPMQPVGMVPVYRQQLAATHACRMCGRVLEHVEQPRPGAVR